VGNQGISQESVLEGPLVQVDNSQGIHEDVTYAKKRVIQHKTVGIEISHPVQETHQQKEGLKECRP
jgi:hypothetical protein